LTATASGAAFQPRIVAVAVAVHVNDHDHDHVLGRWGAREVA
jgi:hypothetical protein